MTLPRLVDMSSPHRPPTTGPMWDDLAAPPLEHGTMVIMMVPGDFVAILQVWPHTTMPSIHGCPHIQSHFPFMAALVHYQS